MDTACGVSMQLIIHGKPVEVEVLARKGNALTLRLHGREYAFVMKQQGNGAFTLEREIAAGVWRRVEGALWRSKGVSQIQLGGYDFTVAEAGAGSASAEVAPLSTRAPMPGLVRQVLVKKGDTVAAGQALVVVEAMKLQLTLSAGGAGVVEAVLVAAGDMVPEGAELVRVKKP